MRSAAPTPAFLLDGEEASRLATDLRVVEGRLPVPAVGVLQGGGHEGSGGPAPPRPRRSPPDHHARRKAAAARARGRYRPDGRHRVPDEFGSVHPANQDSVWNYAQSHPLDYVLTSDEAIGTYAYDWLSICIGGAVLFSTSGNNSPPAERDPLWQAWWVGTTEYARMDARDLTAFLSHAVPDPTMRLNQLLGEPPLAKLSGFVSADTSAGFYQGNADYTDQVSQTLLGLVLRRHRGVRPGGGPGPGHGYRWRSASSR